MIRLNEKNGAHEATHEIPDNVLIGRRWHGCDVLMATVIRVPEQDFAQHFEVQRRLGFSLGSTHVVAGLWDEGDEIRGHADFGFDDDAAEAVVVCESVFP